jgi:hypothetical protein
MKITVDIDTLTKKEIAALKRLQIEVLVKKIVKSRNGVKKGLKPLSPHVFEVLYSCNLCKSEFSSFFKMKKFKRGLKSVKLFSPLILSNVRKEKVVATCPYCEKKLATLTKAEIIIKYLKEKGVTYARQKQCGGNF